MRIRLPASVKMVLDSLHAKGFEAYAVGGCVRDSVMGRIPDDWDITTSALPAQIKEIFRRTVDTGIQHGTVTVLAGSHAHEVTTYRIDGEYLDARHPDHVTFTSRLEEDLQRRDFTINAMAYNETAGLVDLYGGMQDLQRHVIRCVGTPEERFGEDALRMLRALRFSAQLGFRIDPETTDAITVLKENLRFVSSERICTELLKLICSDHPEVLRTAWELGVTAVILPEFDAMMDTPQNNPYHIYTVGDHTIRTLQEIRNDRILRLTMLLHDVGKPSCRTTDETGRDHFKMHGQAGAAIAETVMRRLKLDNDTIAKVKTLITYHDWMIRPDEKEVRHALNRVGEELFPLLLEVERADALAKSEYRREESLQRIRDAAAVGERVLAEQQCFTLKDLAISGRDLLGMGVPKGPEIGRLLNAALEHVLDNPSENEKEKLLAYLKGV